MLPSVTVTKILAGALVAVWLAGCSTEGGAPSINAHLAVTGTLMEAHDVVAFVYAQRPAADVDSLPYSGGALTRAILGIRDRYPLLQPWLDRGAIGQGASGFIVLRDESAEPQLRQLVNDENRDRAYLHAQASAAVGHGQENIFEWLPYAAASFGKEWITQGRPQWWWLDEENQWHRNAGD